MSAPPTTAERSPRFRILPVHLVLDVNGGTSGAAATVVPEVRDAWARNPALSDTLRLCVLDLGADAQVRLPLGDPLVLGPDLPVLPARRGAPGGAALDTVRSVVEAGVRGLDGEGFDVQRPLVWLLIGTAPDDSWGGGLEQLAASPSRPVVVTCCFGAARPDAVGSPTVAATFAADRDAPPDAAVAALTEVLTEVLVRTGHAPGVTRAVELPADDELPGLVTHAPDLPVDPGDPVDQDATGTGATT